MIGSRDLEQRIRLESACRSLTSADTFFTLTVSVRATHLFEDSTSDFKRALVFRLARYENRASVGYKCNA